MYETDDWACYTWIKHFQDGNTDSGNLNFCNKDGEYEYYIRFEKLELISHEANFSYHAKKDDISSHEMTFKYEIVRMIRED